MKQLWFLILFGMVVWSVAFVWAGEEEKAHEREESPRATENVNQAAIQNQGERNKAKANKDRELFELEQKLETLQSLQDKLMRLFSPRHPSILENEARIRDLENLIAERKQQRKRQVEHLRAAAKLLEEADLPETAHNLRRRADDLERELHPRPNQLGGQDDVNQLAEELRKLKNEVQKLRDDVAKIQEQLQRAI